MLKKFKRPAISLAVICMFAQFAIHAQDEMNEGILDELSLGDILSIKLSTGSFLELDMSKSPLSMTIITEDMVKTSGARHMSELLEIYVPGFQYMFNKWNGTLWGLRGVANDRNNKIIYLVNGHKMNTQARDGFQSEVVLGLMKDIERVEVLRGPAGLVYGSGAIAGIINVVTKKPEENKTQVSASFGTTNAQEVEANIYATPGDEYKVAVSAGYRRSDGLNAHQSRIYGAGSWPFPANDKDGVSSDGNYGSTDGNWKVAGELGIKNFGFYFRATRQKENAGGWFIQDPWPEIMDNPNSTFEPRTVDGEMVNHENYGGTESWRCNRRQYLSDNIMSELSYDHQLGVNEIKLKTGIDRNTTRIGTESRTGYESDYYSNRNGAVDETFGEFRWTTNAMFLLKTVPWLQAAAGVEYRWDHMGNDMYGKNEKGGNEKHPIITETDYNTVSFFAEGFADVNEYIGVHLGGRIDLHTRANMANPKVALIARPWDGHSFKLIYQTSSNNGSADNYEYNRWHYDDNGNVKTELSFERQYTRPDTTSDILPSFPPLSTLHELKPEKTRSVELTYTGSLGDHITLLPSVAYGHVSDLFGWSQTLFRVVNVGKYGYLNVDLDGKFTSKYVNFGINHTFQKPIKTEINKQEELFIQSKVSKGADGWYDSTLESNGQWRYYPVASETEFDTIPINIVKDAITADGKYFLNLNTNLTKLYLTIMPFEWMAVHTNLRLFWGLWGRDEIYDNDKGYNYWDISNRRRDEGAFEYLKNSVSKKWNASLHFYLPLDIEVSLFAYDILGLDRQYQENNQKYVINTLRWQQMAEPGQKDLYSTDQRTFGINLTKSF